MPSALINWYFFLVLFVQFLFWDVSFYWEVSLKLSMFCSSVFHWRWTCNQSQTLMVPLSHQIQSYSGLLWNPLHILSTCYFCLTACHICSALSTHQGQKQNMVRHYVLHYLAMSEEDTPREECNFKLEKKWLRIIGVKGTAASRCCKTWVRRTERQQLRVNWFSSEVFHPYSIMPDGEAIMKA